MLLIVIGLVALGVGILFGWYTWGRGGAADTAAAGTSATGERKSWLDYGNFFIVALGILITAIAFLVALYLIITIQPDTGLITDSNEVLAFLTAFFGVVGTLVGAYFAVKTSSDQATGATNLAGTFAGADTTRPRLLGLCQRRALKEFLPTLQSVPLSLKIWTSSPSSGLEAPSYSRREIQTFRSMALTPTIQLPRRPPLNPLLC